MKKFLLSLWLLLLPTCAVAETSSLITPSFGGFALIGYAQNVDFNAVADTAITIRLTPGMTKWRPATLLIANEGTTASLTTAQYGLFSEVAAGGTALVAAGAVMTGLTATGTANTPAAVVAGSMGTAPTAQWNFTTIYFRITQAQGAAASGSVYLYASVIP